ncbi:Ig-like domain-containing protein [Clostridium cylindrosporum]|uniref:SbsA Ig-like domain-containing protein n=1 Tax=Clostridium cylindrosporum DSM 605 TaxID=1121307 RepID=A0A0J8DB88_CLOCY|nr:Ig-like domain-containing protein [Clostridium cylindrosporum]KMT23340.1 hypothetical protein CLCY_8c00770 [Clostridium cylindrosporum DSM 605]
MSKSKKLIGSVLVGAMTLVSVAGTTQSVDEVKIVNAGVKEDTKAVHTKVEQIRNSLKKNFLGLKNVGQWQKYIKEARTLNAKLPKGATKNKYAARINSAEALVNAAARVNKVEGSMANNAHTVKNAEQWIKYVELAEADLEKVDVNEYEDQINSLINRLNKKIAEINDILSDDFGVTKAAIEKGSPDKITITFTEVLKTDVSDVKDSIIVKVDNTSVAVKSAVLSKDGVTLTITLDKEVKAGQVVTIDIKQSTSKIKDKDGVVIYTEEPVEIDNLL